jgi:Tol biopolymer transport system component
MALPSGERKVIVHLDGATVFDVAASPDGKQLAFARAANFETGRTDFGTDIYVSARDGSNQHLLATHSFPNELLRWPAWLAGSQSLLFQVQGVTAVNGVPVSRIDLLDVVSGRRSVFVADARLPATSQDGGTLVYQSGDPTAGQDTIWISDAAGASKRPLLPASAKLGSFGNAAPSPDGSQVVIGAAVPGASKAPRRRALVTLPLPVSGNRDGLPEDMWLIKSDGSGLRLLAPFAEDLPTFAWSADGKKVYLLGVTGLWQVDVATGEKGRLGDGIFHGQVVWGGRASE